MGAHSSGRPAAQRYRGRRVAERTRPRYGRIAALLGALAVTGVAVAAGAGLLGTGDAHQASAAEGSAAQTGQQIGEQAGLAAVEAAPSSASAGARADATGSLTPAGDTDVGQTSGDALPADSGEGRRIVFDQSDQRVWLVGADGEVQRTYAVSGSLTDNLHPGSYTVFSKSEWAVGVDDSGVMRYFVRFAHGENAAIGFHSIPTKDGVPLQTKKQLGTPQSHGCIRQDLPDAIALWNFAPVGTKVVVTA
ncbi:MAG: L,D-transpeptidase [Nocardioidaceae bacterium]